MLAYVDRCPIVSLMLYDVNGISFNIKHHTGTKLPQNITDNFEVYGVLVGQLMELEDRGCRNLQKYLENYNDSNILSSENIVLLRDFNNRYIEIVKNTHNTQSPKIPSKESCNNYSDAINNTKSQIEEIDSSSNDDE
jgi:hypothetical protein